MIGPRELLPNFRRYAIGLQYFGPAYNGWTISNPAPEGYRFIPAVLSNALDNFVGAGNYSNLMVSSRTDAGVHAFRNVIQVDLQPNVAKSKQKNYSADVVRRALNHQLTWERMYITDVKEMDEDYDARGCATGRTYVYRIHLVSKGRTDHLWRNSCVFDNDRAWVMIAPLDVQEMKNVANCFLGEQDFVSVQGPQCDSKSTWRHIRRLDISVHKPLQLVNGDLADTRNLFLLGNEDLTSEIITISITANSFLRNMVRNIVAVIVQAGRRNLNATTVRRMIDDGAKFGLPPAPTQGLYLADVHYDSEHELTAQGRHKLLGFLYVEWLMWLNQNIPKNTSS